MTGSSGDRPPRRSRKPLLTPEDTSLWQRIAASIDPRRQGKPRVPDVEAPAVSSEPLQQPSPPRGAPRPRQAAEPGSQQRPQAAMAAAPPRRAHPATAIAANSAPRIPALDRRQARRIASGTIEIDARLDLHGLTQTIAHTRLIGFLQQSAARGLRTVLVITGKGASRQPSSLRGGWREEEDIGVLRRSVPRWLEEAPLRALVISYQVASPRHGGEGALYILLRRSRHKA